MMNFGGGGQYDAMLQELMRQQQARAQRPAQQPMPQMGGQVMQSDQAQIPQYQGGGQGAGGGIAQGMNALANPQTIAAMMKMWGGGGADAGAAWQSNFAQGTGG